MAITVGSTIGTAPYEIQVLSTYVDKYRMPDGSYIYSNLIKQCLKADAVSAITPVPSITTTTPIVGWNSSAFSSQQISGDVYTQFVAAPSIGVVCGFASERISDDPKDIPHSFYCYQSSGRLLWAVSEGGVPKTTPAAWAMGVDVFRIERKAGIIRYFVNYTLVYTSTAPSADFLRVVCCMYSSEDGVY